MNSDQWIEIFRAGDYGAKGKYTEADLDKIVANYDPALHEAPVVKGHPQDDSESFAWVEALKREGASLLMKARQWVPDFLEQIRQGRWKKRSVSLYPDLAGKGPYLRHVGFVPIPEVKGMADPHFVEHGKDPIDFQFTDAERVPTTEENMEANEVKKTVRETIVEIFSGLFGKKEISAFSEEQAQGLVTKAIAAAEQKFGEKLTALDTQLKETKTALEAAKTAALDTSALQGKAKIATFCERLAAEGKFPPAYAVMGVLTFMESLAQQGAVQIEFGEGDQKKKINPLDWFKTFLEKQPKIVPFGEIVSAKKEGNARRVVRFTENPRVPVDLDSVQMAEEAEALADEKKISYGEALKQVRLARRQQATA